MSRATRQRGKPALELIEEAVHLLRAGPASALASYYLGALPFVLGLLYYWADMSQSAFASRRLTGAALTMALLFIWMKCCQAIFLRQLRSRLVGAQSPLSLAAWCRILVAQAAVQSTGLFLLPLAAVPVLPFGYVYAFYQNLSALGDGEPVSVSALVKKSIRQAALCPGQNFFLLLVLAGFGFVVLLNFGTVCFVLPGLLKMLLGVESIFTRSGVSALNTTFFAAVMGLTYLSVDPIAKACYALRCFYGDSIESGEDLRGELRQISGSANPVAIGLAAALALMAVIHPAAAQSAGTGVENTASNSEAAPAEESVSNPSTPRENLEGPVPQELDGAIREVIQQRKYTWRLPRETVAEPDASEPGILGRFFHRVGTWLLEALKKVAGWIDWLIRKLFTRQRWTSGDSANQRWIIFLHVMVYVLVAAVVAGLALLAIRIWRNRSRREHAVAAEALQSAPDLTDENVSADQLPEEGWIRLARELLASGELRLALRAFYLSSLAHLAGRNLISLAKFKSNREYERELARRGHAFPDLLQLFSENVTVIDRTWYGMHEISGEIVDRFALNVDRLNGTAAP